MKKKKPEQNLDKRLLINVLLLGLTFIVLLNLFMVTKLRSGIAPKEVPQVEITILEDQGCEVCAKLGDIRDELFLDRFEIVAEERIPYSEAPSMIAQYQITRVPAAIIKADKAKVPLPFEYVDDAFVIQPGAPYVDPASGEVRGKIKATVIEPQDCELCDSAKDLIDDISSIALIDEVEVVRWPEERAKVLVEAYGLTKLPGVVLSKEANAYPLLMAQWQRIGHVAQDSMLVMDKTPPPYVDIIANTTKGLITITVITDASCETCSDPAQQVQALRDVGLAVTQVSMKDKAMAGELISRYDIKALPTIIVSGDTQEYPFFEEVWDDEGTWESDGKFIFRNHQDLKDRIYVDLESGELRTGI